MSFEEILSVLQDNNKRKDLIFKLKDSGEKSKEFQSLKKNCSKI
jgi:predicted DNA-binding protein YlxM (UPF0122 family)